MTLRCRLALAAVLLSCAPWSIAAPPEPPPDYAARVLGAINGYRASRGLPPLERALGLESLAAEHSAAMAARRRPSHDGFAARFDRTSGDLCVENVAAGFRVAEQVIDGWRAVATHHRNLLESRVRYAGVANSGLFVTFFACDDPGR